VSIAAGRQARWQPKEEERSATRRTAQHHSTRCSRRSYPLVRAASRQTLATVDQAIAGRARAADWCWSGEELNQSRIGCADGFAGRTDLAISAWATEEDWRQTVDSERDW
jgi:hypothetical protein